MIERAHRQFRVLCRLKKNLARARDTNAGDKNVGPAGKPCETLLGHFQIVRLVKKHPVEQQGLVGADAKFLWASRADIQRLGPGEQRRKLRRGAAAFEKFPLQPPLIDLGGLDLDTQAGVF